MKHFKITLFLVIALSLASTQTILAQEEKEVVKKVEEKVETTVETNKGAIKTINRKDEASVKLSKIEEKKTELKTLEGEGVKEEDLEYDEEEDDSIDDDN